VWLALKRGEIAMAEIARAPETRFAVLIEIRPPIGRSPVLGGLVKGIFDGVICAAQAHSDTAILPEVVARLCKALPADAREIEERLLDQRRAVLGVVPQLVYPYRADVSGIRPIAGALLAVEPVGATWAIRGEIVEVAR
jgi:hypothetical protein